MWIVFERILVPMLGYGILFFLPLAYLIKTKDRKYHFLSIPYFVLLFLQIFPYLHPLENWSEYTNLTICLAVFGAVGAAFYAFYSIRDRTRKIGCIFLAISFLVVCLFNIIALAGFWYNETFKELNRLATINPYHVDESIVRQLDFYWFAYRTLGFLGDIFFIPIALLGFNVLSMRKIEVNKYGVGGCLLAFVSMLLPWFISPTLITLLRDEAYGVDVQASYIAPLSPFSEEYPFFDPIIIARALLSVCVLIGLVSSVTSSKIRILLFAIAFTLVLVSPWSFLNIVFSVGRLREFLSLGIAFPFVSSASFAIAAYRERPKVK